MTTSDSPDLSLTVERFTGFANVYDQYRPSPPPVLLDMLPQTASVARPRLVVDLGSGTGLSTRFWAEHAEEVIGVEPSDDMRQEAEAKTAAGNVSYRTGFSHETGLPDACADIVTVSQALHWMDPQPTFEEAARILREGGVFAAYDVDWPPAMPNWSAEAAYNELISNVKRLTRELGLASDVRRCGKDEHLQRMQQSGCFRYTRETVVHHTEPGNADRLVGMALSQGSVATVLKHGLSEEETGVDELRAAAAEALGDEPQTWYLGYRVRVGIA